jgi:hypothetical protein
MTRARDVSRLVTTPPNIYATDTETSSAGYLTNASASSSYLTQASASTIYKGSNFRNLIINGDMQVAQRGTSASSLTTTGYRTADRWQFQITTQGTWTMSVENDAPTGSGFRKSTKVLCTTADASPASGDVVLLSQTIEGQNLQQIKKGTAAAEQLTVSFWVKSNVTGTYIFEIYDADNTRAISKSYTISTSGVWEYKTIIIPADTTGAFDNDNDASVFIQWFLGAGSNLTSGTLNSSSWTSPTTANRVVGQVNLASAISNYWQITGVQLEVGATATPFEFKPFEQDLKECQRYFLRHYPQRMLVHARDSGLWFWQFQYPVEMRVAPTLSSNVASGANSGAPSTNGQVTMYSNAWITTNGSSVAMTTDGLGQLICVGYLSGFNTSSLGLVGTLLMDSYSYLQFSAEL